MIHSRFTRYIDRLGGSLRTILAQSSWHRGLHVHLLVNPAAGGVAHAGELARNVETIEAFAAGLHDAGVASVHLFTHFTEAPGHATQIVRRIARENPDRELVFVSAGGDGTHGEVLTALVEAPDHLEATIVRLPLGTGNDGADALTFSEACGILRFGLREKSLPYVRITDAEDNRYYAFNIVSLGLDAYVTDIGNKLKRIVPGDIYKVIADVATLFYEPFVGVREMTARITPPPGGVPVETRGRFIVFVFGVSGRRNYGDGKRVLPGEENLCAITTAGLMRKIAIKSMVYEGLHTGEPEVEMHRCRRAVVSYPGRIAMQMDGEAVWLSRNAFPLTLEIARSPIGRLALNHADRQRDHSIL